MLCFVLNLYKNKLKINSKRWCFREMGHRVAAPFSLNCLFNKITTFFRHFCRQTEITYHLKVYLCIICGAREQMTSMVCRFVESIEQKKKNVERPTVSNKLLSRYWKMLNKKHSSIKLQWLNLGSGMQKMLIKCKLL